jgi:hypothetical protein
LILLNQTSIPLPTTPAFTLSPFVSLLVPIPLSSALITRKTLRPLALQLLLRLQPSSFTASVNPRSRRTKLETSKQNP